MTEVTPFTNIAIVDDVRDSAERIADIVEEGGFVTEIISEGDGQFQESKELLDQIKDNNFSAVICDHRLSRTPFAAFTGAELLALLYQNRIPGILLSTFSSIDSDTSIRLYRDKIPSLLPRQNLEPEDIVGGLQRCLEELNGAIAPDRRTRRTMVRVVDVSQESGVQVVDAILHAWNPDEAVRFPLDLIEDQEIRDILLHNPKATLRLFAKVNIGCREDNGLFFKSFEIAPEPDFEYLIT